MDWVAVDVLELLDALGLGEDVEVVIAPLPEVASGALQPFRGFTLQHPQRGGQAADRWLAQEEMDVLGHQHIGDQAEAGGCGGIRGFPRKGF